MMTICKRYQVGEYRRKIRFAAHFLISAPAFPFFINTMTNNMRVRVYRKPSIIKGPASLTAFPTADSPLLNYEGGLNFKGSRMARAFLGIVPRLASLMKLVVGGLGRTSKVRLPLAGRNHSNHRAGLSNVSRPASLTFLYMAVCHTLTHIVKAESLSLQTVSFALIRAYRKFRSLFLIPVALILECPRLRLPLVLGFMEKNNGGVA